MSFRGRRSLAGNRRAAFRFSWLLFALTSLAGLAGAAETPTKDARELPVFAPERDPEAENRPVFGPRKGGDDASAPAARQRLSFAPRGRESAPKDGQAIVKPPKNPFWSFVPVLLLVVCLGCWFVVMLLKRWGIGGKSLFSSPALEVLGRAQIDRGKYIALVRAGKRVLVVGVNPNGFDALGEITNPAEAAEVMMEARPQTRTGKNVFRDLFMQHIGGGDKPTATGAPAPAAADLAPVAPAPAIPAAPLPSAPAGAADAGLAAIQERIRALREEER